MDCSDLAAHRYNDPLGGHRGPEATLGQSELQHPARERLESRIAFFQVKRTPTDAAVLLRRRHWTQKCTRGGSWQLKAASASRLQSALKTSRFRNHREEAEKWEKGCMRSTSCLSYFWGRRKSFKASPTFLRCFYGPFLQTTGYWSCCPGFQPTGRPAGCQRSRVPDRASISLRPPRCVCAAGRSLRESRRSSRHLVLIRRLEKGETGGEEPGRNEVIANRGWGRAGCGVVREKNRSSWWSVSRRSKTGSGKRR